MPGNDSLRFYLKNAFEFEVRNKIDLRIDQLRKVDDLDEERTDELKMLELVREYMLKRIGEMTI